MSSIATKKQTSKNAAVRRFVVEDSVRQEAKEAFKKHTQENSNLDVLQRCKKLNEFLSNDFLKQGKTPEDQKSQLKEILGILNAGPKRPSFLDKPPVTSAASIQANSASKAQAPAPPPQPQSTNLIPVVRGQTPASNFGPRITESAVGGKKQADVPAHPQNQPSPSPNASKRESLGGSFPGETPGGPQGRLTEHDACALFGLLGLDDDEPCPSGRPQSQSNSKGGHGEEQSEKIAAQRRTTNNNSHSLVTPGPPAVNISNRRSSGGSFVSVAKTASTRVVDHHTNGTVVVCSAVINDDFDDDLIGLFNDPGPTSGPSMPLPLPLPLLPSINPMTMSKSPTVATSLQTSSPGVFLTPLPSSSSCASISASAAVCTSAVISQPSSCEGSSGLPGPESGVDSGLSAPSSSFSKSGLSSPQQVKHARSVDLKAQAVSVQVSGSGRSRARKEEEEEHGSSTSSCSSVQRPLAPPQNPLSVSTTSSRSPPTDRQPPPPDDTVSFQSPHRGIDDSAPMLPISCTSARAAHLRPVPPPASPDDGVIVEKEKEEVRVQVAPMNEPRSSPTWKASVTDGIIPPGASHSSSDSHPPSSSTSSDNNSSNTDDVRVASDQDAQVGAAALSEHPWEKLQPTPQQILLEELLAQQRGGGVCRKAEPATPVVVATPVPVPVPVPATAARTTDGDDAIVKDVDFQVQRSSMVPKMEEGETKLCLDSISKSMEAEAAPTASSLVCKNKVSVDCSTQTDVDGQDAPEALSLSTTTTVTAAVAVATPLATSVPSEGKIDAPSVSPSVSQIPGGQSGPTEKRVSGAGSGSNDGVPATKRPSPPATPPTGRRLSTPAAPTNPMRSKNRPSSASATSAPSSAVSSTSTSPVKAAIPHNSKDSLSPCSLSPSKKPPSSSYTLGPLKVPASAVSRCASARRTEGGNPLPFRAPLPPSYPTAPFSPSGSVATLASASASYAKAEYVDATCGSWERTAVHRTASAHGRSSGGNAPAAVFHGMAISVPNSPRSAQSPRPIDEVSFAVEHGARSPSPAGYARRTADGSAPPTGASLALPLPISSRGTDAAAAAAASVKRTLSAHRSRAAQVGGVERVAANCLEERVIMTSSEHRTDADALSIARLGTTGNGAFALSASPGDK